MAKSQDNKEMYTKAIQMSVQDQWTNWSNYVQMDLSWMVFWALPPDLPFIDNATQDTLPTPSNLKHWRIQDFNACPLCLKVGKENLLEQALLCIFSWVVSSLQSDVDIPSDKMRYFQN